MTFRKAEKKDIDAVMVIVGDARARIGRLGIDQWQYGYPSRDILIEDERRERLYVGVEDGEILAIFTLLVGGEPTYDTIYEGEWLTKDSKYAAIHRIAVAGSALGRGYAGAALDFAAQEARAVGLQSIRIDTHEGNVPMRRLLVKNGYTECGSIYLKDGQKRRAYEKKIVD